MSYRHSTQRKFWLFDNVEDVFKKFDSINKKAGKLLIVDECQLVVDYYAKQMFTIVHKIKLPLNVALTCLLLYKHFYLVQSPQLFHPRLIMVACLCLGKKLEEYRFEGEVMITAQFLCQKIIDSGIMKIPLREITLYSSVYEPVIMEVLHFQMGKFNGFDPFYGFIGALVSWKNEELEKEMKEEEKEKQNPFSDTFYVKKEVQIGDRIETKLELDAIYVNAAMEEMKSFYLSNALFLYSPSMLALAAHYSQLQRKEESESEFQKYIQYLQEKNNVDVSLNVLDSIITLSQEVNETSNSLLKPIITKLGEVIKFTVAASGDVDYMQFLNKSNGDFVVMESSVVKWHTSNSRQYQFWCPLGKIRSDKRSPLFQLSPFLFVQPSIFILVFDVSSRRSFEEFKQWSGLRNHTITPKIIVVGVHSELEKAATNQEIEGVLAQMSENQLYIKYFEWNNLTSTFDNFIVLVEHVLQKKFN